jgi:hypothetical protein
MHSNDEVCLAAQFSFHHSAHRPMVLAKEVDAIAGTELVLQLENRIGAKV